ncbi:hypothetical protein E4K68_19995 [Desulfosporosinus sp. Sb-LF]|nr:hypothetical protein E4K68_19995 [Desulfosporosinus sp. Sb-LF]
MSTILQQYLSRFSYRPPILLHLLFEEGRIMKNNYSLILSQLRKQFSNKLNPFTLCPQSIIFWFLVPPYSAIGITILGLDQVVLFWRQQIEPNETVYVSFKMLEFNPPFPLTLFVMFAAFGLVITDASYNIIEATGSEYEDKLKKIEFTNLEKDIEKNQTFVRSFDPFKLTPRMSIYFPVLDNHTTIGFLTIDFRHVELSIKQSLEPNETIVSLIRFLDLSAPFPLQVAVMMLSVGLFMTGKIYEFSKES